MDTAFLGNESTENVADKFNKIFAADACNNIYLSKNHNRKDYIESLKAQKNLAIIDDPSARLANPLISLDPVKWADVVMQQAQLAPGTRAKPLLATVRGMGGGKTRALEEIRWELLQKPGVLPLAITFNSTMDFNPMELNWGTTPCISYAFSVITRLASVLYGISMGNVISRLKKLNESPKIQNYDLVLGQNEFSDSVALKQVDLDLPATIIRGFLSHAVQKVSRSGKLITNVVVLVDECMKGENFFNQKMLAWTSLPSCVKPFSINELQKAWMRLSFSPASPSIRLAKPPPIAE